MEFEPMLTPREKSPLPGWGFFSGSSHTSDLKIDAPAATLPGVWYYGVNAGTGWPRVTIR